MEFIQNGAAIIQKQIDAAKHNGTNKAKISGFYEIEKTVLLPSDFYLVLENCHLRMAENTFCNMFTNENARTQLGRTKEGTDRNITIEGRGSVILDGGVCNGLCERNSRKDGNPHISVNNMLLFANVDGFKISGLHIRNQRWWAMNFMYCQNGRIRDIDFCANDTLVDENGNITADPTKGKHLVKNADGIDLRAGCHDIIIENITGFCQDDTIALTGMFGYLQELYAVEGKSTDMYNLIVRNVNACSANAIVRLLNQSGVKLYNVLVDGVYDASKESTHMDRGGHGVRIGDKYLYGTRHATADECYNITVRNVASRAKTILQLAGEMRDVYLENIRGFDNNPNFIINDSNLDIDKVLKN